MDKHVPNRGRIWVDDPPECWNYEGRYHARVRVRVPGLGLGEVDLTPKSCRALARSLDLAAEYCEGKEREQ